MKKSSSRRKLTGHPASVISYIGGKAQLIENIVPIIEYAVDTYSLAEYMELCGGGARPLLSLAYSRLTRRVYNDTDEGLYALFTCLTEPSITYELMGLLEYWGISEERYLWAKQLRSSSCLGDAGYDILTAAACTFVVTRQSRAATMGSYDRSILTTGRSRSYMRLVRELDKFLPTMRGVEVTNRNAFDWLSERRDWRICFLYIDPPYIPTTMYTAPNHYDERSWSVLDHERLVDVLLDHPAKIALSGYDHELYDKLVANGWKKLYLKRVHVSSSGISNRFKDEYLWINFEIPTSLLDQVSEFDYSRG